MSHTAVNWALEQTGLKPAAKLVLICLADRHNKDTGECFPSQELLARDACISRSSLNDQLALLEDLGFINRHPEIDPVSRRQKRTNYTFNAPFQMANPMSEIRTRAVSEKDQKPCPKNAQSRVRNSDTNPVREPISKPPCAQAREAEEEEVSISDFSEGFWTDLLVALKVDLTAPGKWWTGQAARKHVAKWLDLGLTEDRILEVARKSRERQPEAPQGPKALDGMMEAAAAAPAPSKPASADAVLGFWAEKLQGAAYVAPSSLSISTANELLRRGLVAIDDLRRRGIAFTFMPARTAA